MAEDILTGHYKATQEHMEAFKDPVLILHDTSEFTYNRKDRRIGKTRFLIRKNKTQFVPCGFLMHSSLAITTEGLLLGLTAAKFWTRHNFKNTTKMKRKINPTQVPIEEKESYRRIENLRRQFLRI